MLVSHVSVPAINSVYCNGILLAIISAHGRKAGVCLKTTLSRSATVAMTLWKNASCTLVGRLSASSQMRIDITV